MNRDELKKYTGTVNLTVVDAMRMIDSNSAGLIYVVDDNRKLIGSLTDGDIRRWIIKNGDLNATVQNAMNRNPKFIHHNDVKNCIRKMEEEQIYSLAVLNEDQEIEDIIFDESIWKNVERKNSSALLHVPIIIMAGGKGTRLYPYTKILPKPLIPIGDIPILQRILNRFHQYGACEFFITVNYKKEMIKSYFAEARLSYSIQYIEEDKPLGTAGSVRLIDRKFDRPVIVTNCDVLIDTDYEKILDFHAISGNDMTIVSSLKNTYIPYGVLYSKDYGRITSMEEKPRLSYFVNTGMYVVNPDYLNWIPEGKVYHMTDLAEKMIQMDKQVGMYPVSENSFLDMGEFEEMKKMEEWVKNKYTKS